MTDSAVLVSIGMPVFNGESSIRFALESLLNQSFKEFELIISDNASTDNTEAICRAYAVMDKRIKYYRQPTNLGAERNFAFVLDMAKGEYFMWAAADDFRSKEFIDANVQFLQKNPDYVASVSQVRFEGGKFDAAKMGDQSLEQEQCYERLATFFGEWHANGAFYSLMRTQFINQCPWVGTRFLGADWAIVLFLAKCGKRKRLEQGYVELGTKGTSNRSDFFKSYRESLVEYFLPFWKLTVVVFELSKGATLMSRTNLMLSCLSMNLRAVKAQYVGSLYRVYKRLKSFQFKSQS